MGGAVSALVVFGVLVLIGSPIALSIPGTRPEWTGLAFESAVIGLVVELFVAIVLLHAGYYSLATALVLTVVLVGGAAFALRRSACASARPPLTSRSCGSSQPALIGLGDARARRRRAVDPPRAVVLHLPDRRHGRLRQLREHPHAVGQPFGTQPQGFTLFLRETNLLLGRANTVAGLPALGAILLLGAIAFARALRLHVVAALGVAVRPASCTR